MIDLAAEISKLQKEVDSFNQENATFLTYEKRYLNILNRLLSNKVIVKSHVKHRKDIEVKIQMSLCYNETKTCMINIINSFLAACLH